MVEDTLPTTGNRSTATKQTTAADDLKLMQGTWERQIRPEEKVPYKRCVKDINGPRGGVDQLCRIKVVLRGQPSVIFESRDASLNAAVDGALAGVQRAVHRTTARRRTKPRRTNA